MKRAAATRLIQAGMAIPVAVASLWLAARIASGWAARSADFMPHGYCYLWNPWIVWLNVISDGLITFSYYVIPVILIYFIRKNRDLPFNLIFWMFGSFILACGTTHLMEIWNVWHGSYIVAGVVKAATAGISVVTAAMLVPLVPKVVSLPGRIHLQEENRKLEREIAERRQFDAPIEAPLRRRVTIGFGVAVLLTISVGVSSWRGARRAEQDEYWVSHTHEVMETIQRTSRHVIEAETSARAFALTGQEPLLANYQKARESISGDEGALRHLTADNLSQQQRLAVLGPQVNMALEFAANIIAKRQRTQVYPGGGDALECERLLDAARATTHDMYAEESRLLIQRNQRALGGQRLTKVIAIAGAFLGVGLWGLARRAVNREIDISTRAHAQINTLNAELEQRVEQRTAALYAEIAERERAEGARERVLKDLADQKFALDQHAIVATTDVRGTIIYVNDKFCAISKYSRDELIGQNHRILNSGHHPREFFREMYHSIASGRTWRADICNRAKDGSIYWVDTTIVPFADEDGKPRQYLAIRADITERKRAEEARERLAAVVESSEDAIISKTLEGVITAWNRGAEKIFGYTSAEAVGKPMLMLMPPERVDEEPDILARVRRGKSVDHFETVRVRKDGTIIDISATISPIRDSGGTVVGASKIARDITEHKRAEQAVKESLETREAALKELADQKFALDQHAIVAVTDVQGTITYVNEKFCTISKYSRDELIGQNHRILNSGHHPKEFFQQMYQGIARGKVWHGEIMNRAKDGSLYWVDTTVVPTLATDGKPRQYVAIRADITERKRAEEALRESEERLQAMANGIPQLAWIADADGSIFWYNQRWYEYTGTTLEQMRGWGWQSLHHRDVLPRVMEGWTGAIAEGRPFEMEFPLRGADGTFREFLTRVMPVKNSAGHVTRWFGTNTDISERKQTEERLEAQTEELSRQARELVRSQEALETQTLMLQSVLDSMQEGLVAANEQGKFIIWNPAATKIVGLGAANVAPGEWNSHYGVYLPDAATPFPPERNPLLLAIRGEIGTAEMYVRNSELETGVWIEASASPLKSKDGLLRGGVIAFRDITQRKIDEREIRKLNEELEERVVQRTAQLAAANQELEAFTYSVSHDLRAPLRHIGGFSKILIEDFGPAMAPEARNHLERIQDGARRMGLLVDELLNLARVGRHALKLQATLLKPIVEDVISLLQPEINGRAVTWKIDELSPAQCDAILIKQVFQNLIANALKFTRTRERAVIEISQRQENGETVIAVCDNGVGFSMKYKDKLFGVFQRLHRAEDFEGTGIGLATVQRIIRKHGGRIWAEAELNKGAAFYFTLATAEKNEVRGEGISPDEPKAISQAVASP